MFSGTPRTQPLWDEEQLLISLKRELGVKTSGLHRQSENKRMVFKMRPCKVVDNYFLINLLDREKIRQAYSLINRGADFCSHTHTRPNINFHNDNYNNSFPAFPLKKAAPYPLLQRPPLQYSRPARRFLRLPRG